MRTRSPAALRSSILALLLLLGATPAPGALCGDAIPDPGEECDDGNPVSGDGCSDACVFEGCDTTGTWESDTPVTIPGSDPLVTDVVRSTTLEAPDGSITGVSWPITDPSYVVGFAGARIGTSFDVVNDLGLVLDGTLTSCDHVTFVTAAGVFSMTRLRTTYCGDGLLEGPLETCDDGNLESGDLCPVSCTVCGNGILEVGEACDDGDAVGGDGCSATCRIEQCGNGVLDVGEECDDGNVVSGDDCSATCELETCGNGVLDPGEECDDDDVVGGDGCSALCELEACGNGVLDPGETCEDGNLADGDGCSSLCEPDGCTVDCATVGCPVSGTWAGFNLFDSDIHWVLREDEVGAITGAAVYPGGGSYPIVGSRSGPNVTIDVGGLSPGNDTFFGITSACGELTLAWEAIPSLVGPYPRFRATYCGDGVVQPLVESCDDGNFLYGDACTAACTPGAGCGNGILDAGEDCDDGNATDGDGCSACEIDTCGDGVLDPDEACDDGNLLSGDGCSATCEHDGCSADCAVDGCSLTGTWRAIGYLPTELWTLVEEPDGRIVGTDIGVSPAPLTATGVRSGPELDLEVSVPALGLVLEFIGTTTSCGVVDLAAIPPPDTARYTRVRRTYCGDGVIQPLFEACDDGNLSDGDACTRRCEQPDCGNGVLDPGEACDDGNFVAGDGCAGCALEGCWSCSGAPSACVPVPDGTFCDDGVFCTATSSCSAGACVGSGETCAAGAECGRYCDEDRSACLDPAGTACLDDGDPATEDVCDGYGSCTHQNPGDLDADGILEDGDGSGDPSDNPCTGGATTGCDDNCRFGHNPDQADADGEGVGDVCDYDCVGATGAGVAGTIYRDAIVPGNEIGGALVQACSESCCLVTTAGPAGAYAFERLNPGAYEITAWGAPSVNVLPTTLDAISLAATDALEALDIVVRYPVPLPPGVTIPQRTDVDGVPVLPVGADLPFSVPGCEGGTATYEVRQGGTVMRSGTLVEGPSGTYSTVIPHWAAQNGSGGVEVDVDCPSSPPETVAFDFWMWIDPSGHVRTGAGAPIPGASVTLLRSDDPLGPFEVVPDGSAIMSPSNRKNPDVTDATGHFGWDVIAGWYVVRAERSGCTTDTPALRIPPPVTDLELRLACPDPLLCYQTADPKRSPKFVVPPALSLTDVFRSWSATVRKPNGLCAPATLGGEAPVSPEQEHQLVYPLKPGPRFTAVRNRLVKDRFGTLRLDVMKPATLQPPTAASLVSLPAAPAAPELDDYQCYGVKLAKGAPRFSAIPDVSVEDPLGTVVVDVQKPKRLCLPTERDGTDPNARGNRHHFLCYQVKLKEPKRFERRGPVHAGSAVGARSLDVVKAKELCVPAVSSQ